MLNAATPITDILLECIVNGYINESLFAIDLLKAEDFLAFPEELDLIEELLRDPNHKALQQSFLPVFKNLRMQACQQPLVPQRSAPLPPQNAHEPKTKMSDLDKLQAQCNQSSYIDFSRYAGPS